MELKILSGVLMRDKIAIAKVFSVPVKQKLRRESNQIIDQFSYQITQSISTLESEYILCI